MYDNIGGKIKGLSQTIFIIEAIALIIFGLLIMSRGELMVLVGFLVIGFGSFLSWVSSCLIYGFGELIEKTCEIEKNTRKGDIKSETQAKVDSERTNKLERLRAQGLITEEEYQQAILRNN